MALVADAVKVSVTEPPLGGLPIEAANAYLVNDAGLRAYLAATE
jgi:hypothetical protein